MATMRSGSVLGQGCFSILIVAFVFLVVLVACYSSCLRFRIRLLGRCGAGGWVLEFGTQPADQAAAFFFGALVVQVDQSLQDLFVVQIMRPA